MMIAWLLAVTLLLIVFQTALTGISGIVLYDLMAPFIVCLALDVRRWEAIPVIVAGGLVMDSLSGGVFGIHISVYAWMYAAIRTAIHYLNVESPLLLALLVVAGVAFESLAVAFSAIVLAPAGWPMEALLPVVTRQIVWGAITGPLFLFLFVRANHAARWVEKRFFAEKQASGKH